MVPLVVAGGGKCWRRGGESGGGFPLWCGGDSGGIKADDEDATETTDLNLMDCRR